MQIVDTNVLVYAMNSDAPQHEAARNWLDQSLLQPGYVGFTWSVILGFLRVMTLPRMFDPPLSVEATLEQLSIWLNAPGAVIIDPSPSHLYQLSKLLSPVGSAGNLVPDAHLAALALEYHSEIVSYDTDFDLFENVKRVEP